MIRARILLILPLSLLLAAFAPQGETITIHQRFLYAVCAGVCYSTDLIVDHDGEVDFHLLGTPDRAEKHFHYRLSPAELRAFRAALQPIRPVGVSGAIRSCGDPADPLTIKDRPAYVVEWRGVGRESRLISCGEGNVAEAFHRAYRALHIDPATGKRVE